MWLDSVKTGIKKGLETIWLLSKTIVPVYILVTVLNHTPVIGWITALFKPLMRVFNLPGEAAIVLVIGNILDTYYNLIHNDFYFPFLISRNCGYKKIGF